ncbi:MAG: LPXTG cell wall anchor domain-containing protein [Acutalibacteraceae bacterium]|nr:LPXTG cell wall anchor domain-containing protein [Acutalibacteraceae bacterium]
MKNKLSVLITSFVSIMLVIFSTVTTFAFDNTSVSTGDSTTIVVVILAVLMVAAVVAIVLMSRKKK